MNIYKLSDLKPGNEFDQPVFIEGNTLFLPAQVKIKPKDIDRLKKWGIDEVECEGHIKENLAPIDGDSEQMWGVPSDSELFEFYTDKINQLDKLLDKISNMESITVEEVENISDSVVLKVKEKKFDSVRLILCNIGSGKNFAKSCINCSIIAANIGNALELNDKDLNFITQGGLLHDVGMLRVPKEIKDKRQKLESNELTTMRSHPLYSYQIIQNDLLLDEEVAQIALQHHERWDGEGYPQGLDGKSIEYLARIVSIADAFVAMISERPYINSMIVFEAMKQILSDNSRRFDPEILKIFIRSMGIYPLGSLVLLNDGAIGRVVEVNKEAPLRPSVIVLIDTDGKEYKGDRGPHINLIEEKKLFIARALNLKDLLERNA
ncbi:MAG: HD-GYP domain-containing protein [Spirochaetaceae bacterium]|jgi:HD-GYP domain-containing protein (c-di-GMP phosphodiesterase class II)|nr:HD-GYP domain-containing protein [Spirochaetaceae bacterium]